jgi:NAD(P)-dependent dehydrogenase (short-subunit alcohol dehydrogenase family)
MPVAFPGNSLYHATKWGIEGFVEFVAQEVAPFRIGMTIVEPGGARTEFRYGSAQVAELMREYDRTPAHSFLKMLDPANWLAPGDPARMAAAMIASVDQEPAASASRSDPRHSTAPSQSSASASPTSKPKPSSPRPQTSPRRMVV